MNALPLRKGMNVSLMHVRDVIIGNQVVIAILLGLLLRFKIASPVHLF